MAIKTYDDPLGEGLISFPEKKHYLDESESKNLMLMTYDDKPGKQVYQNVFQPVITGQSAQFKKRPRKILH